MHQWSCVRNKKFTYTKLGEHSLQNCINFSIPHFGLCLVFLHTDRRQPKKSPKTGIGNKPRSWKHRQHQHHSRQPPSASSILASLASEFSSTHKSSVGGKKKKPAPHSKAVDGIPANVLNFPQHLPTHFLEDVKREEERRLDDEQQQEDAEQEEQDHIIDAMLLNKHTEIETEIESQMAYPTITTTHITATSIISRATSSLASTNTTDDNHRTIPTSSSSSSSSSATAPAASDISADSVGDGGDVIVVSKTDIPANVLSANADRDDEIEDEGIGHDEINTEDDAANLAEQQKHTTTPLMMVGHQHHQPSDKLRIITVNPFVVDHHQQPSPTNTTQSTPSSPKSIVLANDHEDQHSHTIKQSEASNQSVESGYYEKTIFNKNGVFIENIRKIANIDGDGEDLDNANKVILNTSSGSHGADDNDSDDSAEAAAAAAASKKKLAMMSAPLSQHYVITSSGRIEKSDSALASDDVIAQFREGLNEYQRPQTYRQIKAEGGGSQSATSLKSQMDDDSSFGLFPRADVSVTSEVVATTTVAVAVQNQAGSGTQPAHCIVMGE